MLLPSALGFTPNSAPIVLSEGADFLFAINLTSGATFPPGTEAWIVWKGGWNGVWPAIVSGSRATWDVSSDNTTPAAVPNGTKYSLYIRYPDGAEYDDYLWYTGYAQRMD